MSFEHEILEILEKDRDRSVRDYHLINSQISMSALNYKGNCIQTLAIPKCITQDTYNTIVNFVYRCFSVLNKVIYRYHSDPFYRTLFDFSPTLEDLILLSKDDKPYVPMARIDFFLDEESQVIKLCEINTDGTSAMNEDRILGEMLGLNSAFQTFIQGRPHRRFELFDTWVSEFLSIYKARSGRDSLPHVAIVDFLDKGTVNEFYEFKKAFERQGVEAEVCDICQLTYDGSVLRTQDGMAVDAIYRRAVTSDIMAHFDNVSPFIHAVRDRAVHLLGGFGTQIIHNKRIFYVLHHPYTRAFLSDDDNEFVDRHVPLTYLLTDESIEACSAATSKDLWIIKPCDSYASRGVFAGVTSSSEDWVKLLRKNAGTDYLLQQFIKPYKTINADYSDTVSPISKYSNTTGAFCYNEKVYGIYSRLAKSEIISTYKGERAVPTVCLG